MNWKEFKKPTKTIDDNGDGQTTEEVVEYFCEQDWLEKSSYSIKPTEYGWRGCFKFKDSEDYIHTHRDLKRVQEFCQKHLDKVIEKLIIKTCGHKKE
jgi:hypothetical protein